MISATSLFSVDTSQTAQPDRHEEVTPSFKGISVNTTRPFDYPKSIPELFDTLYQTQLAVNHAGLDASLHHLVVLRASQINQCGFCVKMHSKEARDYGETNERLDRLIVWQHVRDFSERERAALAWTEALTTLDPKTDYAPLRSKLREHFSEQEVGVLTSTIGMINLWNRIQVSAH